MDRHETKLVSKGFTVERSSASKFLVAGALALVLAAVVALTWRALQRRRRLAVAGSG